MNALKLKKLYAKTISDSPYFCDQMLPTQPRDEIRLATVKMRNAARHRVAKGIEVGNLMWNEILNENVCEATTHMAFDENTEAIDSLYDAMVTIMRTLDVLEGRQELGRKNDAGNKSDK